MFLYLYIFKCILNVVGNYIFFYFNNMNTCAFFYKNAMSQIAFSFRVGHFPSFRRHWSRTGSSYLHMYVFIWTNTNSNTVTILTVPVNRVSAISYRTMIESKTPTWESYSMDSGVFFCFANEQIRRFRDNRFVLKHVFRMTVVANAPKHDTNRPYWSKNLLRTLKCPLWFIVKIIPLF